LNCSAALIVLRETARAATSLLKSFSEILPVLWGLFALISLYRIKISNYLFCLEKMYQSKMNFKNGFLDVKKIV